MATRFMIVAGEVSGDMHAAGLVRALRALLPEATFSGVGGDALQAEGMTLAYHARDMAVMGFNEVVRRLGFFRRVFADLKRRAAAERPDAVILVDYPGFNLRFAAAAHAMGLNVVYYVCPQVWAWNRGRIPKMARIVDLLITIFPFEAGLFRDTGLQTCFAGHPLVDEAREALARAPAVLPWNGAPRVALLPGSRPHEIRRLLPVMAGAAARLRAAHPGAAFLVAAPSPHEAHLARELLAAPGAAAARAAVVAGETRAVLRQADAALVASGTATIEAALMTCPMVVTYRTAPLTYWLARRLVRVPHIGMVNLVAGREICPERVQHDATPDALAAAVEPLLTDTPARRRMLDDLRHVADRLGAPGAADRAARAIASHLGLQVRAPAPTA
jgi:lipid-A-disaccharide synthase